MSENTEIRAECPKKKTLKLTAVILVAVTVAGLWVGAGALLVGMLFPLIAVFVYLAIWRKRKVKPQGCRKKREFCAVERKR